MWSAVPAPDHAALLSLRQNAPIWAQAPPHKRTGPRALRIFVHYIVLLNKIINILIECNKFDHHTVIRYEQMPARSSVGLWPGKPVRAPTTGSAADSLREKEAGRKPDPLSVSLRLSGSFVRVQIGLDRSPEKTPLAKTMREGRIQVIQFKNFTLYPCSILLPLSGANHAPAARTEDSRPPSGPVSERRVREVRNPLEKCRFP